MSLDVRLMANEMMKKAVTYTLNQWKSLENFIEDGRVEISNNLCYPNLNIIPTFFWMPFYKVAA